MTAGTGRRYVPAIVLTVSLFFLWGMANNLNDILIAQFKRSFTLTDFETSFVQQSFYVGYFLFAIPAAIVARRGGYKAAIVTGLLLYAAGALLFYPAARFAEYRWFLAALFVIASGLAFLETAANPLVTELGAPEGAAWRLTLAQAANPLGTVTGVLIGRFFILSDLPADPARIATLSAAERAALLRADVAAVQAPYIAIGVVVLAFALAAALIRFPERAEVETNGQGGGARDVAQALRDPRLRFAAVAQFFYVGAQVGLWSYTIRYAQANVPGMSERTAADYLFASLVLFGFGRLAGSALMRRIAPPLLLAAFALASLTLAIAAALIGGEAGLWALVATSFFMSVQFPTIFALGIERLGPLRRAGSSIIVMAVIGGAVVTAIMGRVSDLASIDRAMLVPAVCFVVVLLFARRVRSSAPVAMRVH
ncbi:MAG: L-fucose:H+ symporter permease [Sphingomonas sp.]|uniref:L-fucose:H+ symporter permease n=1 Tax=Sphingomonas sp. TaxID=28214 RepID=UPI001AC077C8|nr:L-fucose:H+ symporter permease [Sphingomonas sp.]MBN8806822.1 L-fucose:H+ symporter permease [Sphingomonas sp.]